MSDHPGRRLAGWILLALAGLALAVLLSVTASNLSTQPIGLSGEPLRAGDRLAPPSATRTETATRAKRRPKRKKTRTQTTTTPTATQTTPAPVPTTTTEDSSGSGSDDDVGDDHGGDRSGKGGDDD